MTKMFAQPTRLAAGALVTILTVGALSLAGCEDPAALEDNFLIRSPERRPNTSQPVSFTVSETSPDSILFEWGPAPNATRYTVTFWAGESEAQVEQLEADFTTPLMSWDVTSPVVEEHFLNPENPNDDRSVHLVRFRVPYSDVAAELAAAGMAPGETIYTVFSVFAERGGDRWRSPSVHPVRFILAAPGA